MGECKQITVAFAQQRAARIVAALLVGAALGLSGAIFQVISPDLFFLIDKVMEPFCVYRMALVMKF